MINHRNSMNSDLAEKATAASAAVSPTFMLPCSVYSGRGHYNVLKALLNSDYSTTR